MAGKSEAKFVGVDGCKAGWFSVGLDSAGNHEVEVHPNFRDLLDHYGDASLVLVDIPIGLIEGGPGERRCDVEARKRLGHRKSSVFRVPTREAVHKATRKEASQTEERLTGKRIGSTSWGIVPKIGEVDVVMGALAEEGRKRVKEVHPELLFWALNRKKDMACAKGTLQGFLERLNVLRQVDEGVDAILESAVPLTCKGGVAGDDILDALAAAVTAREGYHRPEKLQTLPAKPPKDAHGLPMEMVFYNPTQ